MLQNLGKVGFTFEGEWVAGTTYKKLSVVSYQGDIWCSIDEVMGTPGTDSRWVYMIPGADPGGTVRIPLLSDTVIYVRKEGSDANDGMSEETAKLTVRGALILLGNIDPRNSNIIIDIGPGEFAEPSALTFAATIMPVDWKGVLVRGKGSESGGTILSFGTSEITDRRVLYTRGGIWTFQDLHIKGAMEARDMSTVFLQGSLRLGDANFASGVGAMMRATQMSYVRMEASSTIHFEGLGQSGIATYSGANFAYNGGIFSFDDGVEFTNGFFTTNSFGWIVANALTSASFVGTFTGRSINVAYGSGLEIGAQLDSIIPGTLPPLVSKWGYNSLDKSIGAVRFDSSNGTIQMSRNIASVTRNSVGNYSIVLNSRMTEDYVGLVNTEVADTSFNEVSRTNSTWRFQVTGSDGNPRDAGVINVEMVSIR